ncbi:MAG: hypothetical protein E6Q92_00705 [Burkholderiaceae bacterium]|nr:MAG: hypothetical protein E6Q92_00705 [Burkholderiaceae bacterium]
MAQTGGTLVAVGATKKIARVDIECGLYAHLGLDIVDGVVTPSGTALPPPWSGKWSSRNLTGWDRPRPDWSRVKKTYASESPNFGDAARNGTHMHFWDREVLQHQIFEPQGMTVEFEVLQDSGGSHLAVRFSIDQLRDCEEPEFELLLLWAINILQENTGVAGVVAAGATRADYLASITLDWEIFPPGTVDEIFDRMFGGKEHVPEPEIEQIARERLRLFSRLKPIAYIRGRARFGSYFGAKFTDDLVVFENLRYGNAVYVLYEDWVEIAKRSRLDLLRDHDANLDRVVHRLGWQGRLLGLLQRQLEEPGLWPKTS